MILKRVIVVIRNSIINESYTNTYECEKLGFSVNSSVPYIGKYPKYFSSTPGTFTIFLLRNFPFLTFFVYLIDFFCYLFRLLQYSKIDISNQSLFFLSEKNGCEYFEQYKDLEVARNIDRIILFNINSVNKLKSNFFYVTQCFSLRELLSIFKVSLKAYFFLLFSFKYDVKLKIQLFRVWRICLLYFFLKKCKEQKIKQLIHDNIYCSYAVTIHMAFEGFLVQIQHGSVRFDFKPPIRLNKPNILFCFDMQSLDIFQQVLFKQYNSTVEMKFMLYSKHLDFRDIGSTYFSILIGSRPGDVTLELEIIEKLRNKYGEDLLIIIKGHPVISEPKVYKQEYLEKFNLVLWPHKNAFPKVDVLFCGNSTLMTDFLNYGIRVININSFDALSVFDELIREHE